jgi:hypothetical protein
MKNLNYYQQIQLGVFLVFLLGFVVTGALVIINPDVSDAVSALFSELKAVMLLILSVKGLSEAIAKYNSGGKDEETKPDTMPVS